ncbi:hypothetical protein B0J13DRAFT_553517 [Dactylonectria estremocensis]|uniref:Uncharacterized protein n=1 Tax=Dactylonectria estremocensis TaxID=1079267 RepID=A0A9P9J5L1_9HYPO|nr:hypothetical protein B0J13DRAFT_553517 [Dactylonectria estremocensis]
MFTCRSISEQTKCMPLSLNTIHFSTVYRRDWTPRAGCFNFITLFYPLLAGDMVRRLEPFITPDMYSQLALKFPTFVRRLQHLSEGGQEDLEMIEHGKPHVTLRIPSGGAASSFLSDFHGFLHRGTNIRHADAYCRLSTSFRSVRGTQGTTFYVLRLLAEKQPVEFAKLVYETLPHWVDTHPAHEFLDLGFNLWDIPSRPELAHVASRLGVDEVWNMVDPWCYRPLWSYKSWTSSSEDILLKDAEPPHKGARCRQKIRFSAVAVAIRFLGQLPVDQRRQIRNVTLHEDFEAVGDQPSHAQGLAPLFKENPQLWVERRVSVIRCISEGIRLQSDTAEDVAWFVDEPSHPKLTSYVEDRKSMRSISFSEALSDWLLDALAVPDAGIPAESFRFVLEGGPDVDFCTDLFQQVVQRDIAWHKAYQASIQRGLLVYWPRLQKGLVSEGFAEAMDHLRNQTSFLRSDFHTGHPWNWEDLVEKKPGTLQMKWVGDYPFRQPWYTEFPPALATRLS